MKRKLFFILFYLACLRTGKIFCQENKAAALKGYTAGSEYLYFDSLNQFIQDDLNVLDHSYFFYMTFKIDTASSIIDFEIIEIPGAEMLPIARMRITKLIFSSKGQWQPQVRNSEKVVSEELVYLCVLTKKKSSMQDKLKDNEAIANYFLDPHITKSERLKKISISPRKRYMILTY